MTSIIRMQTANTFTRYTFPSSVGEHFEDSFMGNDEAQKIAVQAQELADKNYQQAYDSGHIAGYQDGLAKGEKEGYDTGFLQAKNTCEAQAKIDLECALSGLNSAITHVHDIAFSMQNDIKQSSLEVIAKVADKVVNKEISVNPQLILNWIESSIASLPKQPSVINVTLNNEDYRRVMNLAEGINANWQLHASQTLSPGCCDVATEHADISINPQQKIQNLLGQIQE